MASFTTIRSGLITRRIEVCARSRRISFIATRLRARRSTSSNTASPGMGMSKRVLANGASRRCEGSTFSSHQVTTSGKDRRRSVSPVGAQSTTTQSKRALLVVALDPQQREELVHAGRHGELLGGDAVHAALGEQVARARPARRPSGAPSPPGPEPRGRRGFRPAAWAPPREESRTSRRGCGPGRSRARRCAVPPRRTAEPWPLPRSSSRRRPSLCRE